MTNAVNECQSLNHFVSFSPSQMDSRLTKVPPTKATISVAPPKQQNEIDETAVRQTIIKNVSAGKAKAYDKVEIKVHNDLQVKVIIHFAICNLKEICHQFEKRIVRRFTTISHRQRLVRFARLLDLYRIRLLNGKRTLVRRW